MTNDIWGTVGLNLLYSLPLMLAWGYALALGAWITRRSMPAGLCLMAAGSLELLVSFFGLGSSVADSMLYQSDLSFEVISAAIFARSVMRVFVLLVSHTLLLLAIYAWRDSGRVTAPSR